MKLSLFGKVLFVILAFQNYVMASVVGEISRMQVLNANRKPFTAYGQVNNFCSGTLISPLLVLTAAHCVYDQETQSWTGVKTFTPAKNGILNPFGVVAVEKIYANPAYLKGDSSQDVAVLVLKDSVGLQTGWLSISWDMQGFSPRQSALGGLEAAGTITGYPGDKMQSTLWTAACSFYVPAMVPYLPQYRCDTFGGMSGSSIVIAGPQGESRIVGVHTTGHGGFNSGVMLTGPNKNFVQSVMKMYSLSLTP